jgi:hypothetical protein
MAIKLATDAAATWAAVGLTVLGGIYTTALHYGANNQQIAAIQAKQEDTDRHVAKHDDQLSAIQQQQAANAQALTDIKDTVHDIQSKVHEHDNHR